MPETEVGGVVESEEMRCGASVRGPRGWEGGVGVVSVVVDGVLGVVVEDVDGEGARRRRVERWKVRLRRWSWGQRRMRRA